MTHPDLQHLLYLTEHATPGDRIVQHEDNPLRGTYIFAGETERSGYCLHGLISDPDAQLAALAPETLRNIVERLIAAEKLAKTAIQWAEGSEISFGDNILCDAVDDYRETIRGIKLKAVADDYNHNSGTPDLPDRLLTEPMDTNP